MHGTIEQLFRVEWRPLAELAPLTEAWRTLAANALEPNVFYEPAFALAAAPVFGRDVSVGLIWSRTVPDRLMGLFPARVERRRYGVPVPLLVGWTHPYAPLGTPLVDRDAAEPVIAAWFDHLNVEPAMPGLVLMPFLPTDGALASAVEAVLARSERRSAIYGRHQRALLAPASERTGYLARALGHKKRKELGRQRRRLGDLGVVMRSSVSDPEAVARGLADFLAVEAGGWKGRAGSAAHADAGTRRFVEDAVTGLAGEGKARIDRLFVDARAIAALILLRSGNTAWTWKIAYDESFARSSPGVQLLTDATQALLDDASIARADSCATADHPMIDHIWRERLPLADRLIGVRASAATFACACVLESLRRAGIAAARSARDLLRR